MIYTRKVKNLYIPESWMIIEYESLDEFNKIYSNTKTKKYVEHDGFYYAFDYDAHIVMCVKIKGD